MLERLFLLFCFFPFVSPYPIDSDIQPLAGIFALIVVVKHSVCLRKPMLIQHVIVLVFSCSLLAYNNPFSSDFDPDLGKMVSLFFGALILVGFYYSQHRLDGRFFNIVIGVYFIFTILLLMFTAPMIEFQNMIIRNTNSTDFNYRGVSTFCTEPGLFGGLLVFFLLITDHLKEKSEISSRNQYVLYALILFMIIWTRSGTGYLYFIFYLIFKFFISNISKYYKFVLLFISCVGLVLVLNSISQLGSENLGRGMQIIIRLIEDPQLLLQQDSSVFVRVVDVSLAFVSFQYFPFGVGNGDVRAASYYVMQHTAFIKAFYGGKVFGLNSSFTYLAISYGLFFWLYILLLYKVYSKSNIACKFFSIVFFTVSYSSAFPAIWLLLALKLKPIRNRTR